MIIAKLENEKRNLEHLISIHLHKKYIGLAYLVLLFILSAPNDKKIFQIKLPQIYIYKKKQGDIYLWYLYFL